MILSKEMISFLYGNKYLSGRVVFILYVVVDMVKFANMSIVLSACGRTKTLMICSVGSLAANYILNIVFYNIFGFYGPAIATVVVTVILTIVLAEMSSKALQTSIVKIIDWSDMLIFILQLVSVGVICMLLRNILVRISLNSFVILIIIGLLYMGAMFGINMKKIKRVMKEINTLK